MAVYKNSFENFADGATLAAAGSAASGETAFESITAGTGVTRLITATAPAHGSKALNLATSATSAAVYAENTSAVFGTLTDVYARFYLKLTAAPPATSRHLSWRTSAGACTEVALTTGRQLRILNVSSATAATLSTPIPLNQWVRVEYFAHLDPSGNAELRLYLDPDSTTVSDSVTASGQNFRAPATIYRLGITTAVASMPSMFLDGLGFSDTTWLGPADLKPVLTMPGAATVARNTDLVRTASATDPEGTAVTYLWSVLTQPSGAAATLTNANTASVTFNTARAGNYVLQCVATDATGKSTTGTTAITVPPSIFIKRAGSLVPATMTRKP